MAGSIESGLSSQEKIPADPKSMGMDTTGDDQKPMSTPCESVKKGGKDFEIC